MTLNFKILLSPLSLIFGVLVFVRNWLYDHKYRRIQYFTTPVVSVGNLTMGGTGKTPLLCELVNWALAQNLRVGVVSRGYRGYFDGVKKVIPTASAVEYGDEPVMMAKRFTDAVIYVGKNRVAAVTQMLNQEKLDIIFADDGFQHRALGRTIDIVVVDATESWQNYSLIPVGRAREPFSALSRANYIFVNKVNLVKPEKKQMLLEKIEKNAPKAIVIECEYYLQKIEPLKQSSRVLRDGEKIAILSAIGNPSSFYDLVAKKYQIVKHFVFRDHHVFSEGELRNIFSELQILGVEKLVVTEKDAVKLLEMNFAADKIWVALLSPKLGLSTRYLNEQIFKAIKSKRTAQ